MTNKEIKNMYEEIIASDDFKQRLKNTLNSAPKISEEPKKTTPIFLTKKFLVPFSSVAAILMIGILAVYSPLKNSLFISNDNSPSAVGNYEAGINGASENYEKAEAEMAGDFEDIVCEDVFYDDTETYDFASEKQADSNHAFVAEPTIDGTAYDEYEEFPSMTAAQNSVPVLTLEQTLNSIDVASISLYDLYGNPLAEIIGETATSFTESLLSCESAWTDLTYDEVFTIAILDVSGETTNLSYNIICETMTLDFSHETSIYLPREALSPLYDYEELLKIYNTQTGN